MHSCFNMHPYGCFCFTKSVNTQTMTHSFSIFHIFILKSLCTRGEAKKSIWNTWMKLSLLRDTSRNQCLWTNWPCHPEIQVKDLSWRSHMWMWCRITVTFSEPNEFKLYRDKVKNHSVIRQIKILNSFEKTWILCPLD